MADISSITLPNGDTYNLKDTVAREAAASATDTVTTAAVINGALEISSEIDYRVPNGDEVTY